jgi:hypothetical protein
MKQIKIDIKKTKEKIADLVCRFDTSCPGGDYGGWYFLDTNYIITQEERSRLYGFGLSDWQAEEEFEENGKKFTISLVTEEDYIRNKELYRFIDEAKVFNFIAIDKFKERGIDPYSYESRSDFTESSSTDGFRNNTNIKKELNSFQVCCIENREVYKEITKEIEIEIEQAEMQIKNSTKEFVLFDLSGFDIQFEENANIGISDEKLSLFREKVGV